MKKILVPLLALSLLLGACSTAMQYSARLPKPPPPVRVANRATVWGERPAYEQSGQYFFSSVRRSVADLPPQGTGTIDVLVDRDGAVQDAIVVTSSGSPILDHAFIDVYRHSHYSLRLGSDAAAPHVVRETFRYRRAFAKVDSPTPYVRGADYTSYTPLPEYTESWSHPTESHSQLFTPAPSYSTVTVQK
jgi:hypothetical protein